MDKQWTGVCVVDDEGGRGSYPFQLHVEFILSRTARVFVIILASLLQHLEHCPKP